MPGIRLTGTLTCTTQAEADIVHRNLPEHIRLSRAEPGCLTFDVLPTENPMVWRLDETFVDAAAFAAHQARTRNSVWGTASQSLLRDFRMESVP